jgi:hypothetical protein
MLDHAAGEVSVFRPDGTPYELGPTQPWTGPNTQAGDTDRPARRLSRGGVQQLVGHLLADIGGVLEVSVVGALAGITLQDGQHPGVADG